MLGPQPRSGAGWLSRRSVLAGAAGAVAVIPLGRGTARAQAPATVLGYSDHEPLGGMRTRFLRDTVFPAIARESGGRLRVEDHWNGELAGAYEALAAAGKAANTDMATVVPEYTAKELPLHQIFKSFPVGPNGAKQVAFFRRVYREVPELSAELAANDLVPLFFGTGYPVAFYGTAPLADLGAVAGGRWRSASFWHQDFLRNAGATPVSMRWGPEIYSALSGGTLNGLMVNVDSGYALKIHEAAPNILVSKDLWLGHLYLLAMKKSVWDALAAEDRDALARAAEQAYATLGAAMDASFDAQVEDLRKAGAAVRVLGLEEARAWEAQTRHKQVQAAWIAQRKAEGLDSAEAVLDRIASVMAAAMA